MTREERTRALRYKKPALATMGFDEINRELLDILEACADVRWYIEQGDETLLNALGDDEESEWEFRMAFCDLEGKAEQLMNTLREYGDQREYDDCTVALIGNRYNLVGYYDFEEDYFSLCNYESGWAQSEAGKRLMRNTKADMLAIIGKSVGTLLAFYDLRQQYDYLKATMDILRDENTSLLKQIKEIARLYEEAAADDFCAWAKSTKAFDRMLEGLPDRMWVE